MEGNGIKLADWAKANGLTYKGAYRLFRAKQLPLRTMQLPTGTIIVYPDTKQREQAVVLYGRVSSHDQKSDLQRQMGRLRDYAAAHGLPVTKEVAEIGSGLNGRRKGLLAVLVDPSVTKLVVEHRDRLARFGVEYIEAALAASERELVILNATEAKDDLVQDFADVVTSMCARIYGRRSAGNRAKRALEAAAR